MVFSNKYLFLISVFSILTFNLYGQFCYDTLQLKELEIIANQHDLFSVTKKTSIDTIARKELGLTNIGELLSAYTPVFVKSYGKGSLSTVSFRGTGASHTKVLWEGFDINSPMLGQTDFSLLPGSFFDEIELHYGGSSLTETSGALGGSINLSSGYPFKSDFGVNINQSVGSFNTFQTAINVKTGSNKLFSDTRFFRQSSDNDFPYLNTAILPESQEMKQTNADFRNIGFTQQLAYKFKNNQTISFITWNQWNERNIPAIMTNIDKGGNQDEHQNDFYSRNVLKWNIINPVTSWDIKTAYFHENLEYYLHSQNSLEDTITLIDSRNKMENVSLAGKLIAEPDKGLLITGDVKAVYQKVISNNYVETKDRKLLNASVGIKKDILNNLSVEAVVRSEISDVTVIQMMPMLGVNFKPVKNQDFHFRFVISRNQNIPSLNDLYWYPGGNENLEPEISIDTEAGADYLLMINNQQSLSFSVSAYSSWVRNWIIWLPGDYRYWSPENIAKVYARGLELSLKTSGTFGKVVYNIFCEYAYTLSTYNSDEDKKSGLSETQLIYIPKHTAVGYLNFKYHRIQTTWSLSYTGARNTSMNSDTKYSNQLPAYMLNDLSASYGFKMKKLDLDLKFKIYNLFNIDYQAILWRAMPGRNYELQLKFKL